jgi:hypothetical protein
MTQWMGYALPDRKSLTEKLMNSATIKLQHVRRPAAPVCSVGAYWFFYFTGFRRGG